MPASSHTANASKPPTCLPCAMPRLYAFHWRQKTLAEIERQIILDTLARSRRQSHRGRLALGVTVRTLQNKLKRYREEAA